MASHQIQLRRTGLVNLTNTGRKGLIMAKCNKNKTLYDPTETKEACSPSPLIIRIEITGTMTFRTTSIFCISWAIIKSGVSRVTIDANILKKFKNWLLIQRIPIIWSTCPAWSNCETRTTTSIWRKKQRIDNKWLQMVRKSEIKWASHLLLTRAAMFTTMCEPRNHQGWNCFRSWAYWKMTECFWLKSRKRTSMSWVLLRALMLRTTSCMHLRILRLSSTKVNTCKVFPCSGIWRAPKWGLISDAKIFDRFGRSFSFYA